MAGNLNIDRCQCYQVLFGELLEVAERTGASTVGELQAHCGFGLRCGLCHPYVRRMLKTGETTFDRIITDVDEPRIDTAAGE